MFSGLYLSSHHSIQVSVQAKEDSYVAQLRVLFIWLVLKNNK